MTDYDIDSLLNQSGKYPTNDKLLSKIAFYYMENPDGNKDLEYLEKAYQINSSIENTHNLAYHLMYEYGDEKRSLSLQKQVLEQQPLSYYPYASYAQMLQSTMVFASDSTTFKSSWQAWEYIRCLKIAIDKFSAAPVKYQQRHFIHVIQMYNNLAYAYKVLKDNKTASDYLAQCLQLQQGMTTENWSQLEYQALFEEEVNKVQLNMARILIASNYMQQAKQVLDTIVANQDYDKLDVATEYARLGEYQLVRSMIGNEVPDESWDWIWYAIYQADYNKWLKTRKSLLEEETTQIEESLVAVKQRFLEGDLDAYTSESEIIEESKQTIKAVSFMLRKNTHPLPKKCYEPDFDNSFHGCLLFGCPIHGNLVDDTSVAVILNFN
nr:hypothetical protein [uncultured Psychrobacter sp.]